MKKNNLVRLITIIMVSFTSLCNISCEKDEDAYDTEDTITENLYQSEQLIFTYFLGRNFRIPVFIYLNSSNNLESNCNIADVGKVKGLSRITEIPKGGWSNEIAAIPGHGYVLEGEYSGIYVSTRFYIVENIVNKDNEIIGVKVKYQQLWNPSNLF